jgi:cytochrome c-type biogenesis protein CcmE
MTPDPDRKRRLMLIGSLTALGVAVTALSFGGIEKNLVYYLSPEELLAKGSAATGATVRLGGVVQKGSVHWDARTMALSFAVGMAEQGEPHVQVAAHGAPPQMFQEGIGAVVEGVYDGHVFAGERVMVKHSNEYRPPSPDEAPDVTFRTLDAPDPPASLPASR